MSSGYIRIDKDLLEDPRLRDLASYIALHFKVAVSPNETATDDWHDRDTSALFGLAMLGALVHLWSYADTYVEGADKLPVDILALCDVLRLPEWIVREFPTSWVHIDTEGRVRVPGYVAKNQINPRDLRKDDKELQREKWAKQKAAQRAKGKIVHPGQSAKSTRGQSIKSAGQSPPVHPPTGTVPVPVDHTREPVAALASAPAHLAQPEQTRNGAHKPTPPAPQPAPPDAELRDKALKLSDAGLTAAEITRQLAQFGATRHQVEGWLEPAIPNRPEVH